MTTPPLPESPCVRVRLDYTDTAGQKLGSRFYLSYASSAPSSANCVTLAGDIAAAWDAAIGPGIDAAYSLTEVDVLDIATNSGNSGIWQGGHPGHNSGTSITSNAAFNVEYKIARRYRGGKPRMFLPPNVSSALEDVSNWSDAAVTAINGAITTFFSDIEALSIGSMGALQHVNLSFYKGFTNIANSSGRERAVPTYRGTALVDVVTGYATKKVVGSQKRRRTSTAY